MKMILYPYNISNKDMQDTCNLGYFRGGELVGLVKGFRFFKVRSYLVLGQNVMEYSTERHILVKFLVLLRTKEFLASKQKEGTHQGKSLDSPQTSPR